MICVSISNVTYKSAAEYARKYPFVEFRLDTLPISVEEAGTLFSIAKRSIVTCRPEAMPKDRREILLKTGLKNGADFVDIEIDSKDGMLEEIGQNLGKTSAKLIISYHNFEETPSESKLMEIYDKAMAYNADIVKIACTVNSQEDNLRLLSLCVRYPCVLAIGMGQMGKLCRVLAPFLSTPFTFAYPDEQQPAADLGQLPYSTMKRLQSEFQGIFNGET